MFAIRGSHLNGARDWETIMSEIVKELGREQQGFEESGKSI